MHELINQFIELSSNLLRSTNLNFKRFLYDKIDFNQRMFGLVGPRGVGKTTLILQHIKEHDPLLKHSLYISADHVSLKKGELYDFAKAFHIQEGGTLLCIDEIHKYANWNQELKNIYDSFPKLKIIFSGSSSINLIRGKYDLSRRAAIYNLPGLSFREYLILNNKTQVNAFTLEHIIINHNLISLEMSEHLDMIRLLRDYHSVGYYPFFLDVNDTYKYYERLSLIIEKTIYEDISSSFDLKTENLQYFGQILNFLALSSPGEFSVNKVSKLLGKNHETISNYLSILIDTRLVRTLSSSGRGKSTLKDLKKVFIDNSNLLNSIANRRGQSADLGTIRELFVLSHLQNSGHQPKYPQYGDLKIGDIVLEIGGKSKNDKQIRKTKNSFVVADNILASNKSQIPMYLFGFLY